MIEIFLHQRGGLQEASLLRSPGILPLRHHAEVRKVDFQDHR